MKNLNKYLHSVLPSRKPKIYPKNIFSSKEDLQKELQSEGLSIVLGDVLKGGFFAQVYAATLDNKPVVVKHVGSLMPFDPTEFYIPDKQFFTDVKILKRLQKSKKIRVPHIIASYPRIRTVILEDMRESGFVLMSEQILKNILNEDSASQIGITFALLASDSRKWKQFSTNESAEQNIYERGLELRLIYPNSQQQYLALEKEFTENNEFFCWPDGHPKNVFINEKGEVAFIDFGRSCWADQKFMLPNFLAQIAVFCIAGYIRKDKTVEFIRKAVKAYSTIEQIDEKIFCEYFALEVLHRAAGKWMSGINTREQKLALYNFGLTVFDEKVETISGLLLAL
jgi:hypothetical protein